MACKLGKTGKQKNHRSTKKTFRKTGSGKLRMQKAGVRHLLLQKSKRQKKKLGHALIVSKGDAKNMNALAPSL